MNTLTTQQWDMLKEYGASDPLPLHEADLSVPFVYHREIGVIHCPAGRHRLAMSGLLAVQHGFESGIEVAEQLGLDFPDETADRWLEDTPGSAFRSSVGRNVLAGRKGSLTPIELRWLGQVTYLFD